MGLLIHDGWVKDPVTKFARTLARNDQRTFGVLSSDRLLHLYIIGKTGTGKSTMLETMMTQDLSRGQGLALIDPHGDLAERVAKRARRYSATHTYLNVPDPRQPYGYNPLKHVGYERIPLAASGLLEAMKKSWHDAWGVRMEHILRNALMALLEHPGSDLRDILRLFSDKRFRRDVARSLRNKAVKEFWEYEFQRYSFGYRADGTASIQNKLGAFLSDPVLNRILTHPKEEISVRRIMDSGETLLVNLAKGQIGEDSASVLGGLLVTTIGLAAMSRADMPEKERKPFFVYIDEFQSFTTLALANMLSELRKYGVGMTIAHQYLHQLDPDIRHAVLGNAGTIVSFRLGAEDAPYIRREFEERFLTKDFVGLHNHHIYLKLMIDGQPSKPFSATTITPADIPLSS